MKPVSNLFSLFFQFQMPLDEVERRTMWMSVWHSDMFGRNDFLGEVMLPLSGQPLEDPSPRWYSLLDRVSSSS
jgi:synaptotagmin-like protein